MKTYIIKMAKVEFCVYFNPAQLTFTMFVRFGQERISFSFMQRAEIEL